jgi:hypothetical protein
LSTSPTIEFAQLENHVSGALAGVGNILEGLPDLRQVGWFAGDEALGRLGIA